MFAKVWSLYHQIGDRETKFGNSAFFKNPLPLKIILFLQFLQHILQMGGRSETILMCVKFNDDPISSLDFCFSGGVGPTPNSRAELPT